MIKLRLVILLIILSHFAFSQNFEWAKSYGGNYYESGNSIVTDSSGNIYSIGVFTSIVDFNPHVDSTYFITSTENTTDIFINKFNSSGKFQWAKKIGGHGYDEGTAITIDAEQNLYITGLFEDSADFDPSISEHILVSSEASRDAFVAKYNSQGDYIWARSMGGNSFDIGMSICVDKTGSIFVSGYFVDTADFNPSGSHFYLNSQGGFDAFVLKLNSTGSLQWAKGLGGSNYDIGYSVSLDDKGNVYATGQFQDTLIYNVTAPNKLISQGAEDIFIIKLNTLGNVKWAKSFGSKQSDIGYSVAVDKYSNVYSTGQFQGIVDFNPNQGISNLSALKTDIYISKLDSMGNYVWAKSFNSITNSGVGNGFDICFDNLNNLILTGSFSNSFDFDPDTSSYIINTSASSGVYAAKLSSSGKFIWAESYEGMGNVSMDIDSRQNIYLTGAFKGSVDFDPGINMYSMYAGNDFDAYILKLGPFPDMTGNINGLTYQCPHSYATFSIPNAIGATYYIWDVPKETIILSGQNTTSIQVKLGSISGNVSVTPFNSNGSGMPTLQALTLKPMNEMGFTINNQTQCLNGNVFTFNDTTNTSYTYRRAWYVNNENSTLATLTKTLTQTGVYDIKLIGTNQYYCYDTISKTIEVKPMPKADFNVDNSIQCLKGNTFNFSDLSTISSGGLLSKWNFGTSLNDDTSTLKNPIKIYAKANNYTVKLIATSNKGCSDTIQKIVTVNTSPNAGIITGPSGTNTNIIYNYSVKDSVGLSYKWTMVNGLLISGQGTAAVQVKWLSVGSGEIKVEVTNSLNCKDISTFTIAINKVGVEDISKITDFAIYPNPNIGQFEVKFNLFESNQTQISILNMLGQEVWVNDLVLSSGAQLVSIQSNLGKGMYVLRLRSGETTLSKTLLVD